MDNQKKNLLSSNISSTCPHNMVNLGPLAAEIGSGVWAPLQISTGSRLGSITARHSSSGRQPNFAALNRGRHLYLAGRPSHWVLAHISSFSFYLWDAASNFSQQRMAKNVLMCHYEITHSLHHNCTAAVSIMQCATMSRADIRKCIDVSKEYKLWVSHIYSPPVHHHYYYCCCCYRY